MATLYDITQEYTDIVKQLEESGGELTPELEERMAINSDNFEEKMEGYAKVLANYKGDVEAVENEIRRLTALKQSRNNTIDRLKAYMLNAVQLMGEQDKKGVFHLNTSLFKFATRRSKSLVIDIEKVPKQFVIEVVEKKLNREGVKEIMDMGGSIDGVTVQESVSLQIR